MGKEMGNNNISRFREEDKTSNETPGKSPLEYVNNVNDATGENEVALAAESKDCHDQGSGLASDDHNKVIEDHAHNPRADGGPDETEVLPLVESPKAETRDEAGSEVAEFQSSLSSRKLTDREEPTKSHIKESELKRLDSFKKVEEEVMSDSTSDIGMPPYDHAEPLESLQVKFDQQEDSEVHGDQLEEDITCLNLQTGTETTPGSSAVARATVENDRLLETYLSASRDELDVLCSVLDVLSAKEMPYEDNTPSEEKWEAGEGYEGAKGLSKTSTSDILTDVIVTDCRKLDEVTACPGTDSSVPESEARLIDDSINFKLDVSLLESNSILPTEETELAGEEDKHDPVPNQSTLGPAAESDINESNALQTFSPIGSSYTKDKKEAPIVIFHYPDRNGSCQSGEAKIGDYLNEAAEGHTREYKEEMEMFPEFRKIPSEPSILNGEGDTEQSSGYMLKEEEEQEKLTIKVVEENAEASFATQKNAEEKESQEQFLPLSFPLQAEAYTPSVHASLSQSQDQLHQSVVGSEDARDRTESTFELKSDRCFEFFVSEASNFQAITLTEEDTVLQVELPIEKSRQADNQSSKRRENFATCVFARTAEFQLQESWGRLRTESNPDYAKTHQHKPRSPSFDFDLRIDARSEESDRTPLLCHDKSRFECLPSQADRHGEELYQYHTMEVEEKVIILERSDSEKSRTPFLGFMKGQEEKAHVVVVRKKQDNHSATKKATNDLKCSTTMKVSSASSEVKEKNKRRSSLFGSCICCTTAIS